jgi:hypothetical protein
MPVAVKLVRGDDLWKSSMKCTTHAGFQQRMDAYFSEGWSGMGAYTPTPHVDGYLSAEEGNLRLAGSMQLLGSHLSDVIQKSLVNLHIARPSIRQRKVKGVGNKCRFWGPG